MQQEIHVTGALALLADYAAGGQLDPLEECGEQIVLFWRQIVQEWIVRHGLDALASCYFRPLVTNSTKSPE
jgi:hypothetical protein